MQRVVSKSILASIVSLAFVVSIASAKFGHSAEKSTTVEITQSTQVPNGPTLPAGTYKVTLLGDSNTPQVGFYQDRKLVGQAPAKLVDQKSKSNDTEVYVDNAGGHSVLTEIDVNGWTKSIQFGNAASGSGSGQSGQ